MQNRSPFCSVARDCAWKLIYGLSITGLQHSFLERAVSPQQCPASWTDDHLSHGPKVTHTFVDSAASDPETSLTAMCMSVSPHIRGTLMSAFNLYVWVFWLSHISDWTMPAARVILDISMVSIIALWYRMSPVKDFQNCGERAAHSANREVIV